MNDINDTMQPLSNGQDPYLESDRSREACPVARSERLGWELRRHSDIVRALHDHETFSNRVSHHLSVPNGMDPPEHTPYRRLVEPFFSEERLAAFAPVCRRLASALVAALPADGEIELMTALAQPFAVRAQCAFLGWPERMQTALRDWAERNQRAIRNLDRAALAQNAHAFEAMIDALLHTRRDAGARPEDDLTARLMFEEVGGRRLLDEEIVSILRNWTAGEVGTISASVGILARFLAEQPDLQRLLRDEPGRLGYAIDEILRIRAPLLTNRRVTQCPVEIGGEKIGAQERVSIVWVSGNRDGRVFEDPLAFRWDRDPKQNLLYGAGIHACPGAGLARLELRVVMEELLAGTRAIAAIPDRAPEPAQYPAGGYAAVPMRIRKAAT